MKTLYNNIKTFILDKLPDVAHVDIWNDQIVNITDIVPFNRPAIFVEFGTVEWTKIYQSSKVGFVPVILHIVTDCYDVDADDMDMMSSLDLLNDVEATFDNSALDGCTPFSNTTTQTDHNHGNLIENIISYSTEYTKCIKLKRNFVPVTPDLKTEGTIKKPLI